MGSRIRMVCTAAALAPLVLLAACSGSGDSSPFSPFSFAPPPPATANGSTTITETGSTLLLPLVSAWQVAYGALH